MVLRASSDESMAAFVDSLTHFGIGVSWGGYESLVIPFTPGKHHGARWPHQGKAVRMHVGLEDPEDLIADLQHGLASLARHESSIQVTRPRASQAA